AARGGAPPPRAAPPPRRRRLDLVRPAPVALDLKRVFCVAVPAPGQLLGASLRVACVVDVAGLAEPFDGPARFLVRRSPPLEVCRQVGSRAVAAGERPRRGPERRRAPRPRARAPPAAVLASSTGDAWRGSSWASSRAETTCPSAACAWIAWRIPCTTSGCSFRNAAAFWRPWPRRSSPKLKYEPDFETIFRSSPASSTVPSHGIPSP